MHKGLWKRREGKSTEVAVKMLKSEAPERSRAKFLQEAVTMSKFDHPNILQIHGIVAAEGRARDQSVTFMLITVFVCAVVHAHSIRWVQCWLALPCVKTLVSSSRQRLFWSLCPMEILEAFY